MKSSAKELSMQLFGRAFCFGTEEDIVGETDKSTTLFAY